MRVIISGGGTGGHIFPAIAIANSIRGKYPDSEILFIGAKDRMEMERVPKAGYEIVGLWISGLQRRLTYKNLSFPFKVIASTRKARKIIKGFSPDIVIGVGGYASGPTLRAAARLGIPTLIQEQNSYPGITNKLLAKKTDKICVAYDNMEKWFEESKTVFTGNPIRKEISELKDSREEALSYFDLDSNKQTILAVGGSLGAKTINDSLYQGVDFFVDNDIELIWQTGRLYYEKAKALVEERNIKNIKVYEFIDRMDLAYTIADTIISRAGAIAISELCIVGKPAIFVPSPNVSEDHQRKNAQALVDKNAALMVLDLDSRVKLIPTLDRLMKDKDAQEALSKNIKALGIKDADNRILNVIEALIK